MERTAGLGSVLAVLVLLFCVHAQTFSQRLSLAATKYYTAIDVGTPPQQMQVVVDTSSALLYFPEEDCASGDALKPCMPPRFNRSASSSLQYQGERRRASYGSGDASYSIYYRRFQDAMGIAGVKTDSARMATVFRYSGSLIRLGTPTYSGVLGMSPPTAPTTGLVAVLAAGLKSGNLGKPVVALWMPPDPSTSSGEELAPSAGVMTLGGWDPMHAAAGAELVWLPLAEANTVTWTVSMTSAKLGTATELCSAEGGGCRLRIDSSKCDIGVPAATMEAIYGALGADQDGTIRCSGITGLPEFQFAVGGSTLSMPGSAYTYTEKGSGKCKLWFREGHGESWAAGFPFTRHFYSVYDYGSRVPGAKGEARIGLATARGPAGV